MIGVLRHRLRLGRACLAVAGVVAALVGGASARGGMITFESEVTVIDPAAGDDTLVTVDLVLTQLRRGAFRRLAAVVGSNDLQILGFEFSPDVLRMPGIFLPSEPDATGKYASEVWFGFLSLLDKRLATPLLLGTLTVDASGLGPGTYDLVIDAAFDEVSLASGDSFVDPLYGAGVVLIVPEPATLVLLGLASVAVVPRRRAAS